MACAGITDPSDAPVTGYWFGTEKIGNVHVHITFVQIGNEIKLQSNCVAGRCDLHPMSTQGFAFVGDVLPVEITSANGRVSGSQVNISFNTRNNRVFSFIGKILEDGTMTGKISGPTLPETSITFEKRTST